MTKNSKLLMSAILTAFVASTAAAQTGDVAGRVTDDSNHAISGITVRATDLLDGSKIFFANSDQAGGFRLTGLPVGTYIVSADTLNTSWVQKHDSPVVRVTTEPSDVQLVLVNLSQLQAGGGGGISPVQVVTLGAALVGAGSGIAAYSKADDAENAANDANQSARGARDQARSNSDRLDDLTDTVNDTRNAVNRNSNKLDALDDKLDQQGQQLDDLGRVVEEIRDSIFR